MEKEMALKLLDAGYPLQECELDLCIRSDASFDHEGKNYHYPLLHEILEELGLILESLEQFRDSKTGITKWYAYGMEMEPWNKCSNQRGEGLTVDVAAAELWLKTKDHEKNS